MHTLHCRLHLWQEHLDPWFSSVGQTLVWCFSGPYLSWNVWKFRFVSTNSRNACLCPFQSCSRIRPLSHGTPLYRTRTHSNWNDNNKKKTISVTTFQNYPNRTTAITNGFIFQRYIFLWPNKTEQNRMRSKILITKKENINIGASTTLVASFRERPWTMAYVFSQLWLVTLPTNDPML